jgi:hypothetical protein
MVKLLPMMPKRKYMLQSYRKNKKESNHTMNSEEKAHQFFGKSNRRQKVAQLIGLCWSSLSISDVCDTLLIYGS